MQPIVVEQYSSFETMQPSARQLSPCSAHVQSANSSTNHQAPDQISCSPSLPVHPHSNSILSDQEIRAMISEGDSARRLARGSHDVSASQSQDSSRVLRQTTSRIKSARPERDMQDWRELADFLRTNEPPPSNFMSIPEDENLGSQYKKGPLKIFRRQINKSSALASKHLQLPDSAVAAKTRKGHWHIAISIPLSAIGAYSGYNSTASDPAKVTESECGATSKSRIPGSHRLSLYRSQSISILKASPSNETRILENQHLALRKYDGSSNNVVGKEAADTLKNSYSQEFMLESEHGHQPSQNQSSDSQTTQPKRTFVPLCPSDLDRNDGRRTDFRHSGGTAYSERTVESPTGHSRDPSSVSTAPSAAPSQLIANVDLPYRTSSRQKTTDEAIIEPSSPSSPKPHSASIQQHGDNQKRDSMISNKSFESDVSFTNGKIAEAAYGCQPELVSSVRNAPRTPAPTRALPDLPECSDDGHSHRSHSRSVDTEVQRATGHSLARSRSSAEDPSRQMRQEKVKAIRLRDINAHKANIKHHQTVSTSPTSKNQCHAHGPSSVPKFRTVCSGVPRHVTKPGIYTSPISPSPVDRTNTLSPIMTVATTSPCLSPSPRYSRPVSDDFLDSLFPFPRRTRNSVRSESTRHTITPPRSLTPSLASSDDDGVHLPRSPARSHAAYSQSSSRGHRRKISDAGSRRRTTAREDDFAQQLKKLENSNAMILQTLAEVMQMGSSIKELNQMLMLERRRALGLRGGEPGIASVRDEGMEREREGWAEELEQVEPLMGEIRLSARNSRELERGEEEGFRLLEEY